MKYSLQPLTPSAAAQSATPDHNFDLQVRKLRLRSTIDFQRLSFHQLTNPSFSNSFLFSSIQNARVSNPTGSLQPSSPRRQPIVLPHAHSRLPHHSALLSTFRMNSCKSVSKQRTLSFFRMNTYAKTGGGGPPLVECGREATAFTAQTQAPLRHTTTGRRRATFVACSNAYPNCSTPQSSWCRPTICNPIGNPLCENAHGTDIAGFPAAEM